MSEERPHESEEKASPSRGWGKLRALAGLAMMAGVGVGGFFASTHFLLEREHSHRPEPAISAGPPAAAPDHGQEVVDLSHNLPAVPEHAPQVAESNIEPIPEKLEILLLQGDNHLAESNPAAALKKYAAIAERIVGGPRPEIILRLALAEEAVGDHNSALKRYRELAACDIPNIVVAARLGQARLWHAQENYALADSILVDLLLNEASAGMNSGLRGDIAHLLAAIATENSVEGSADRLLDDHVLILPILTRPLAHLLEDAQLLEQLPVERPQDGIQILNGASKRKPDEIEVAASFPRRPTLEILAELARICGYRVRGTREIQHQLAARAMKLETRKVTVAVLLDGLLVPDGLVWDFQDGELYILSSERTDAPRMDDLRVIRAERALQYALSSTPDHPWAPAAYISLGKLRCHASDLAGAERFLEQTMRVYPRSEFDSFAAFDLGKVRLAMGKLHESRKAFLHAVDASHGKRLEPAGYLYAGRLSLELGQPRQSIAPLTRAVSLKGDPRVTREACILLAAGYLLGGNAVSANSVLMDHNQELGDEPYRDVTAFLSTFAQFHTAEHDPERRTRDGRALLNSLEHAVKGPHFGMAVPFLAAQAAGELNIDDEARRLYEEVTKAPYQAPLKHAALYALAGLRWESGEREAAVEMLDGLIELGAEDWQRHARIQRCGYELALSNGTAVVDEGQRLLELPLSDEERSTVLQMMGKALQVQGKHELAAYCFAGVSPAELMKPPSENLP